MIGGSAGLSLNVDRGNSRCPSHLFSWINHLIRPQQQRRRDREAQGFGGLEVDDEFEFRRLLDGEISWLGASENLVHIDRSTSRHFGDINSIGHEATLLN